MQWLELRRDYATVLTSVSRVRVARKSHEVVATPLRTRGPGARRRVAQVAVIEETTDQQNCG